MELKASRRLLSITELIYLTSKETIRDIYMGQVRFLIPYSQDYFIDHFQQVPYWWLIRIMSISALQTWKPLSKATKP